MKKTPTVYAIVCKELAKFYLSDGKPVYPISLSCGTIIGIWDEVGKTGPKGCLLFNGRLWPRTKYNALAEFLIDNGCIARSATEFRLDEATLAKLLGNLGSEDEPKAKGKKPKGSKSKE